MRSVSYVQRVALEFSGSLFPHAICLGDVDNDTLNELVVGDTSGKLSVYKNDDSRPWLTCSCQGMLTCVGVGDVCNKGKNLVVAVSAEGWFHLCDLTPAKSLDGSGHHETLGGEEQRPVFKQHIPANTKVMLISDIDGDGRCELVVGYTDRVVRAFRWEDLGEGAEHPMGQLVLLKKWMLEGQVDSLSVTPGPLGVPELMVSQPGCAYAILLCTWNKDPGATPTSEGPMEGHSGAPGCPGRCVAPDLWPHPQQERLHSPHRQHQASHSPDSSASGLFALCTLDGTLKLMEEADRLLWSVQVDHQLFALEKLDVTGNGHEEVVACAWDGQTYIIDHNRTVVRFQVDENIRAFCAGLYACKDSRNSPCLVYVTFNQKIYVYWEVQLERMESTNLLKVLEAQPSSGSCWESWAWILMSCPPPAPCFTKPSTIQTSLHSAPPRAPRTPPSWTGFLAEQGAFCTSPPPPPPQLSGIWKTGSAHYWGRMAAPLGCGDCRPPGRLGEGRDKLPLCPFPCVPHLSRQQALPLPRAPYSCCL
ncbi:TPA: integrin-alpha FG-GAP repeat-containing protein 2 [Bos taurus]|uniref:KICSTOR complex protein ITFG2 n=1 Tax=Bos taurus TaxID=9913 RepID=ITFG2_BOVIN|nr:KICSTOR complex protein ITFG2 [Bos taurus]Q27969.1 RecName: Full=KICSTOR complex protein ITFG2; AltName: Full=Adrenal medulla 50 kDa protein; AltName: Full=Integrin-alpha FG-GAP repeat-containing protein 2 [Bos taurus]AAA17986.1 50 kDa protein [Bos taurus]DAA29157.1 TPA: integrin-alpha FG-GAP repeat-containing protein 2 [Bos taurus]